jgi:hypothetical protein
LDELIDFVAALNREWTTDDLWPILEANMEADLLGEADRRALGAAMTRAAARGIVFDTGSKTPSTRRHATPIRVWRTTAQHWRSGESREARIAGRIPAVTSRLDSVIGDKRDRIEENEATLERLRAELERDIRERGRYPRNLNRAETAKLKRLLTVDIEETAEGGWWEVTLYDANHRGSPDCACSEFGISESDSFQCGACKIGYYRFAAVYDTPSDGMSLDSPGGQTLRGAELGEDAPIRGVMPIEVWVDPAWRNQKLASFMQDELQARIDFPYVAAGSHEQVMLWANLRAELDESPRSRRYAEALRRGGKLPQIDFTHHKLMDRRLSDAAEQRAPLSSGTCGGALKPRTAAEQRAVEDDRMLTWVDAGSKLPGGRNISQQRFFPAIPLQEPPIGGLRPSRGAAAIASNPITRGDWRTVEGAWRTFSAPYGIELRVSKREAQRRAASIRSGGRNARVIAVGGGRYVAYVGNLKQARSERWRSPELESAIFQQGRPSGGGSRNRG